MIWFHGASVGELQSIIPLLEKLEKKTNINQILITSNTLSSLKIMEKVKLKKVIHQFYPIDHFIFTNIFLKFWKPNIAIFIGTSATVLSTLLVLSSTDKSESNYAVLIVIPLFLYSMVLLFTLKIGNEKILNRNLAIDLSISTLIGSVVFTFIRFLSVSGNSNIMNLLIYLTIIALAFIVSLNVIKMKYIKVRKE